MSWSGGCGPANSALAIEIPPQFGQDVSGEVPVSVGAWVDGAMPLRGETIRGYVEGMHLLWLKTRGAEKANLRGEAGAVHHRKPLSLQPGRR